MREIERGVILVHFINEVYFMRMYLEIDCVNILREVLMLNDGRLEALTEHRG